MVAARRVAVRLQQPVTDVLGPLQRPPVCELHPAIEPPSPRFGGGVGRAQWRRGHDTHPQRRTHHPDGRLRHLPAARRRRHRRRRERDRGRLPAARHRGQLRERARGRRGDPALGRAPRRALRDQQDPRPAPRVRRRDPQHARVAGAARPRAPGPPPHPLAQPERREVRRGVACARRPPRAGPRALHRRLELHRGAPRPDHRRDRGDPCGEPARAAPRVPAGGDARGQRGPGHRDRVVEPAGQEPGEVRRRRRVRTRRAARRDPGPGHPALAAPGRGPPHPEVRRPRASAPEPRPLRLRADRRRGRCHHRSGARRTGGSSTATPTTHEEM